jgi:outer membrane protein TolC
MKIKTLILLQFSFCVLGAFGQDTLTVEQATRMALKTHPSISQALSVVDAAEARASQTESQRYPEIGAEALYTRLGPVSEMTIPKMGTFKLYPADNYDAHVGARFTLFDFGKTGALVDLSRSRALSTLDAVVLAKKNLAMQTIRTFYTILYLQKSGQVQDEQIEALNEHILAAQKHLAAGTATQFDVLTTQVRVSAAQNQKVDIENMLSKQQTVLRQLINAPPDVPVPVRGEFIQSSASLNVDSLVQLADRQRVELVLARDAERSSQLQVKIGSLARLPSLKANLLYGFKNGLFPDLDKIQANWVAGIKAEMPIFEGGRIAGQEKESRAALLADQAHVQDVERQIRGDVEQAAADVQAALSKIQICQIQMRQAREAVAMARTRYETGSLTNLDLLDAETAESGVNLSNLQALYRYVISRYELERAVGNPFYEE